MNQNNAGEQRAEYVAGLHALAVLIEQHPELPLPLQETFSVFCDDKDTAAAWVRALPGPKDKTTNGDEQYMLFGKRAGVFGPHGFLVWIERGEVCTRVVTGTREVIKSIPTATKNVVVTEDVVEWVCEPLLAAAVSE